LACCASCSGDRTTVVWDDSALTAPAPTQGGSNSAGSATSAASGSASSAPSGSSASGSGSGGHAEISGASSGGVSAGGSAAVSEGGAVDVAPGGAAGGSEKCLPECCGSADVGTDEEVIADSERGFSGTQGKCGWTYGYLPSGDEPFTLLATYDASDPATPLWEVSEKRPPWLAISARRQHPNLIPLGWIVRRWTSNVSGAIGVRGRVAMADPDASGDGIVASVRVAGKNRWELALAFDDSAGRDFSFGVDVEQGTIVDFIVAPGNGDAHDSTAFSVVITR